MVESQKSALATAVGSQQAAQVARIFNPERVWAGPHSREAQRMSESTEKNTNTVEHPMDAVTSASGAAPG